MDPQCPQFESTPICLAIKKLKPDVLTDDHVPVAVTVEGSSEAEPVLNLLHPVDQIGRIGQVGVGMAAAEVLQDVGLKEALLGSAKLVPEDPFGIRSSHYKEKNRFSVNQTSGSYKGKKIHPANTDLEGTGSYPLGTPTFVFFFHRKSLKIWHC